MKRVLMRMGLVLVALVGVLVVVGLFLPRQWHVERSVVINAPPEHIHPFVDDFKAWRLWAVWDEIDPEAKHEYSPKTSGVGAWWSWNGPTLRHGKMLITRSDVSSGVWIEELDEAGQNVDGHLTTLTWTQEGGGDEGDLDERGPVAPGHRGLLRVDDGQPGGHLLPGGPEAAEDPGGEASSGGAGGRAAGAWGGRGARGAVSPS
ncbi:hypothetical protein F0U61_51765 [Archangium violaceum]|uniref:hypothetical protein n=1 Tax=Archangium violaceum TaxID=83451 RepID=UPI002B293C76|nr:hypothetical protein F0U61_51765 [Archangium violaceum]